MTTKQHSSASAAVTSNSASRQAAQILYRMANATTSNNAGITTEPITPVLVGPTMLQPSPAHFAVTTSGFNQAGGSGLQQAHNFIPVYFQSPAGSQGQLKQEGASMTFQFQPQQYQVLQQQAHQPGRTVYLTTTGDNQQYQVARMANGAAVNNREQQQPTGKGRAGGRKPTTKDDKLSSEELDRRKVRRERNKQAAARCRKRRMDQTNVLTEETEGLEEVQNQLKSEIERFQQEISDIQFILEAHRNVCPKNIPVTNVQTSFSLPSRSQSVGGVAPPTVSVSDTLIMPPPNAMTAVVTTSAPFTSSSQITGPESVVITPAVEEAGAKKRGPNGTLVTRPASLPVKLGMQQLDLLAMPTPSPSKLFFSFETHSGLTPTGTTPTGLTPLIPSCSTDVQEKSDLTSATDASTEATSPNNLVSL